MVPRLVGARFVMFLVMNLYCGRSAAFTATKMITSRATNNYCISLRQFGATSCIVMGLRSESNTNGGTTHRSNSQQGTEEKDTTNTNTNTTEDHTVTGSKKKHKILWTIPPLGSDNDEDTGRNSSDDENVIEFEAIDGETLRTAALRRGLVSPHNDRARLINCRGLGTCGTCAVEVKPYHEKTTATTAGHVDTKNEEGGSQQLPPWIEPIQRNRIERARLNFPPHDGLRNPHLRLACQVQIRGDVTVTKRTGFWGQGDVMVQPSTAETYFGELEFLLDRKSPQQQVVEEEIEEDYDSDTTAR